MKLQKTVFMVLFLILLSLLFSEETNYLRGVITDERDNLLISNISITIEGTNKQVFTSQNGNYIIENIPHGFYKVISDHEVQPSMFNLKEMRNNYLDFIIKNLDLNSKDIDVITFGNESMLKLNYQINIVLKKLDESSSRKLKGNLEGIVIDRETHEIVPFASVYIDGTRIGAQTDKNGKFLIENIPIGKYNFTCNQMGFDEIIKYGVKIYPELTNFVLIKLNKSSLIGGGHWDLDPYYFYRLAIISGTVFDENFNIIADANISFDNKIIKGRTNKCGEFRFELYTKENKDFLVSHTKYPVFRQRFNITFDETKDYSNLDVDVFWKNTEIVIDSTFLKQKKQKLLELYKNTSYKKYRRNFSYQNTKNSYKTNDIHNSNIESIINNFNFDYPLHKDHSVSIFNEAGVCPWNDELILLRIGIQGKQSENILKKRKNLVFIIDVKEIEKNIEDFTVFRDEFYKFIQTLNSNDKITVFLRDDYEYPFIENIKASKVKKIIKKIDKINSKWVSTFINSKEIVRKEILKFEKRCSVKYDNRHDAIRRSILKLHHNQDLDELATKYSVMNYLYNNCNPDEFNLVVSVCFENRVFQLDSVKIIESIKRIRENVTFIDFTQVATIEKRKFSSNWKKPEELESIFNNLLEKNELIAKDLNFTIHYNADSWGKEAEQAKELVVNTEMKTNFQYSYLFELEKKLFTKDEIGILKLSYFDPVSFKRIDVNQPIILSDDLLDDFYFTSAVAEFKNNSKPNYNRIIEFAEKNKGNSKKRQKFIDSVYKDWRYKQKISQDKLPKIHFKID
ncbi:MAG: carboxypeptidase-like regulatory domain-containing protein [Candidatus Cloacimonetes bacterium]|nr:carboxypeptidase-like regulatory domain-containing protein [Candidatus Cloacimonadota bacterium]